METCGPRTPRSSRGDSRSRVRRSGAHLLREGCECYEDAQGVHDLDRPPVAPILPRAQTSQTVSRNDEALVRVTSHQDLSVGCWHNPSCCGWEMGAASPFPTARSRFSYRPDVQLSRSPLRRDHSPGTRAEIDPTDILTFNLNLAQAGPATTGTSRRASAG